MELHFTMAPSGAVNPPLLLVPLLLYVVALAQIPLGDASAPMVCGMPWDLRRIVVAPPLLHVVALAQIPLGDASDPAVCIRSWDLQRSAVA